MNVRKRKVSVQEDEIDEFVFCTLYLTFYLNFVIEFAASEPVKDLDSGLLLECLTDVRQLLDLFNQCDFSAYFHDFGEKNSKYPRVTPQSAIKLLEK